MKKLLFAHRPPSPGIHLLSDPFPERVQSPSSLRAENEDLISSKQKSAKAKAKKSGLDA